MPVTQYFEWDEAKDAANRETHGVSFSEAQAAFLDPERIIVRDLKHSREEERFFCLGKVNDGVLTVRFTMRKGRIRIFGAGYWREGKKRYDQENNLHG